MVVDDFPSVGEVAEDEGEEAVRSFAIRHGEVVFAAHRGGVGAEGLDAEIREFQLAHFMARARVCGAVVVEGLLPSAAFVATGEEGELGGPPVSGHEGFEVVAIPGGLLGVKNRGDGLRLVRELCPGVRSLRGRGYGEHENEQEFKHDSSFGSGHCR
jgi:hypothetical protein